MKEYLIFNYDGISSEDMGVYNVSIGGGLFSETFMHDRSINEIKARGKESPYLMGVEREPLSFSLTFAFKDNFDSDRLRKIARWLNKNSYKELFFQEKPEKVWYCMAVGISDITHNGMGNGYITVQFRCDSPYVYSPMYLSEKLEFIDNPINGDGINYTFVNNGDIDLKPELWIEKIGDGDVSIYNTANKILFSFSDLVDGETVYIDNEREDIESDYTLLTGEYRYDNFNNKFLIIESYGRNILNIKGDCKLQFRYRFKTLN